jgi:hypothetical protein
MTSFQQYKDRVSILQVAENLGYKPVKGKFTKARPVLQDASGDTILIKNPTTPGNQLYWNLGNDQHGSVIDFVKNNLSRFPNNGRNEIDGINRVLSGFAGVAYDNTKYMNNIIAPQKGFNDSDYSVLIPTVKDLSYLTGERKLDSQTVADFLPFIRLVQMPNGFRNVAFPFTIPDVDDMVRGYELRNSGGFKSFSPGGDKVNAAWVADFSNSVQDVDKIYFFESAIDAMSFYELHKNKLDVDNSVFVSTGGYPCVEQFVHVFNAYRNEGVQLYGCHDNDLRGHIYDITLACTKEGQMCQKNKKDDAVEFVTNGKRFTLQNNKINLKNFFKNAEIQSNVMSLKPKNGKDWNEVLKNKNVISEKKPVVFKIK